MIINGYSIYCDFFSMLGCVDKPYWELYDGEECHRFFLDDWRKMFDLIDELDNEL